MPPIITNIQSILFFSSSFEYSRIFVIIINLPTIKEPISHKASRWGYISFLTGIILTIFVMVLYKHYNKIFQAGLRKQQKKLVNGQKSIEEGFKLIELVFLFVLYNI